MVRIVWLGFMFLLAFLLQVQGQTSRPFTDPTLLLQDAEQLISKSKLGQDSVSTQHFITALSQGYFSDGQKNLLFDITRSMQEKRYSTQDQFLPFFSCLGGITLLEGAAGPQTDSLLVIANQFLKVAKPAAYSKFLKSLSTFLSHGALYKTKYNSLYVEGSDFKLKYIPTDEYVEYIPEEEEEYYEEESEFLDTAFVEPAAESSWDDWGETTTSEDSWGDSSWDETTEEVVAEESAPAYYEASIMPTLEGPMIEFTNVNLWFDTPHDSIAIKGTSGTFKLLTNEFVGNAGTFDWSSAGLSPDSVYAELSDYSLMVSKIEFSAEKVNLVNLYRLEDKVEGALEFKSTPRKNPKLNTWPRFISYGNNIRLLGIANGRILYTGGFSMIGQKISSKSMNSALSRIELQDNASTKFVAFSKSFVVEDSTIHGRAASISIYHDADSIYHPSVRFRYEINDSTLTVLSEKGLFKHTPFTSSFFKMEFDAEMIKWKTGLDSLDISVLTGRNRVPVLFESQEFFDENRLDKLTGLYPFNPLLIAVSYARKQGSSIIYADDLATYYQQNPKVVKGSMLGLLEDDFIEYESNTGKITLKQKAYHYAEAKTNKTDYDDLRISSKLGNKPNATFDLKKHEMKVRGVKRFDINRKLDVYIEPKNQEITLLANRDILFDGMVFAGNYKYIGQEFRFDYDSFLINMTQIDSMKFNIETKAEDSKVVKRQLDNQLVETAGTLYINRPDNKSAREVYPEYPRFTANKGATVYFIGQEVLGGAYDNTLFFTIPPFEIDSVSDSDPATIGFAGLFNSGGIFPEFEEILKVMPDGALGFEHPVPQDGFNIYGKPAKFYGEVRLDNGGLRGGDRIEHLTSTFYSSNFVFFKDSISANASSAIIRPGDLNGASFPQMSAKNFKMKWLTRKDSLYMRTQKDYFRLYDSTATFKGTALLSSKGLYGAGILETRGSVSKSRAYSFSENNFKGRHASFQIKSSNPEKPALNGLDVRLSFDLLSNKADISPEREGVAAINFPFAQYKTSISKAVWDLSDKTVTMTKPPGVPLSKSYFYTTRPDFDSLAFNATGAKYDINTLTLNVFGIPYIKVADAKITPFKNEVLILENAELQKLENATLEIDTLNGYHQLIDGQINILSRKKFEGDATYRFVSVLKDTSEIKLGAFRLESVTDSKGRNSQLHTVSSGEVKDTDKLLISPGMYFKGNMTMRAYKQALELDGFVKLNLENRPGYDTWIKYKSDAEQQEVVFDFNNSFTEKGEVLHAGLHFESGTNSLYSTFANDKRTPADIDFFKPTGLLSYDPKSETFKIEDPKKAANESYAGSVFDYKDQTGDIQFEGKFNFLEGAPKALSMLSSGNGKGNLLTNEFTFNTLLAFQYALPTQVTDAIGLELVDAVHLLGPPEATSNHTSLLYKLAEILGDARVKAYEDASLQNYVPINSLSGELMKSILFSDVNLVWSEKEKAWYSSGKLGLANVTRNDVNAAIDGFMEIRKSLSGESVHIFLQLSPSIWYYLGYEEGRMLIYTANEETNNIIASKSNAAKAKAGQFVFLDGDMETTLGFIDRFRKTYYDIDVPYALDSPSMPVPVVGTDESTGAEPEKKPTISSTPATEDDDDGF